MKSTETCGCLEREHGPALRPSTVATRQMPHKPFPQKYLIAAPTREAGAQLLALAGHAHGAVVGVTHARHDAAGGNHGLRRGAERGKGGQGGLPIFWETQ